MSKSRHTFLVTLAALAFAVATGISAFHATAPDRCRAACARFGTGTSQYQGACRCLVDFTFIPLEQARIRHAAKP